MTYERDPYVIAVSRIIALEDALRSMLDAHHFLGVHPNGEIETCRCAGCRAALNIIEPQNAQSVAVKDGER